MKTVVLEQRSPEWLAWRNSGIGSSDAPAVVGLSPWKTRRALLNEKRKALAGVPPAHRDSWAMARGREKEADVLAWHASLYGVECVPGCGEHDEHSVVRASFDGHNHGEGLVVEVKCPKAADHASALAGKVPAHYEPQCLHLLLVSGSPCLHYVSFNDLSFAGARRYAVVPVYYDERVGDIERLLKAELEFWSEVVS